MIKVIVINLINIKNEFSLIINSKKLRKSLKLLISNKMNIKINLIKLNKII